MVRAFALFRARNLLLLGAFGASASALAAGTGLIDRPAIWNVTSACQSIISRHSPKANAYALGIPDAQLIGLSHYATEVHSHIIILKPTDGSIRFQNLPDGVAKPMKALIKDKNGKESYVYFPFKSARDGPLEGTVVKPTVKSFENPAEYAAALEIWEKHWPAFENSGYTLNRYGVVRDPNGKLFFSDYDLVGVIDAQGKRRRYGADGDQIPSVEKNLAPLNEAVGNRLFRHDGYFEKKYLLDLIAHPREMIILGPNGKAWAFSTAELPKILDELGCPLAEFAP